MLPVYYQSPYPVYHQVVSLDPSPSFRWCPRKMPMNWNMISDVDVQAIVSNMDVNSLEYLVQHIAFANITDNDAARFGDRGALKAFQLLQLGVEYLTHLKRPLPTQPDSAELKKALSESQRRVEELEAMLYETNLQLEREKSSSKIYKTRLQTMQKHLSEFEDDDDGELVGMQGKSVDPFASVREEIKDLQAAIDQRGKAIEKRGQNLSMNNQRYVPRSDQIAQQIEDLFVSPTSSKRGKRK